MTIDLTRRLFVFGTATALAGAALARAPDLSIPGPATVLPIEPPGVYKIRRIFEITAGAREVPAGMDRAVTIALKRNEGVIYQMGMNARGTFRWCAIAPDHEIVIRAEDVLGVEWNGADIPGQINLFVEDDGRRYLESYKFPADGGYAVERVPLDLLPGDDFKQPRDRFAELDYGSDC